MAVLLFSGETSRSPNDFEELLLIQEDNGLPRQTLLTLSVQS